MTSLEIAELTGKQHFHVMEAIRKMEPAWVNIAASNFRLGTYKDANGQLRPCYSLKGEKKVRTYMTWTLSGLRYLNAKLGYPNF
jgi:phage regulator Rha-like protein